MSKSNPPDTNDEPPTNYELSHRVARMEQNVDYVKESVDRIENNISSNQQEIIQKVDEMETKVDKIWHVYLFTRWVVPLLIGSGGAITYYQFFL